MDKKYRRLFRNRSYSKRDGALAPRSRIRQRWPGKARIRRQIKPEWSLLLKSLWSQHQLLELWGTIHVHLQSRQTSWKSLFWLFWLCVWYPLQSKVSLLKSIGLQYLSWHVFIKLGYFWLFLSAPVQAASGDKNKTPVLEHSKRAKKSPIFWRFPISALCNISSFKLWKKIQSLTSTQKYFSFFVVFDCINALFHAH